MRETFDNDWEVYEVVHDHLLSQKRKSEDRANNCLYRGPDGTSCAIGCLLNEDEAIIGDGSRYGSLDINELMDLVPSVRKRFRDVSLLLLMDLQNIHDSQPTENWGAALNDLKKYFDDDRCYQKEENY